MSPDSHTKIVANKDPFSKEKVYFYTNFLSHFLGSLGDLATFPKSFTKPNGDK